MEKKCPWLLKNGKWDAYLKERQCYARSTVTIFPSPIKADHEHYYQVQMQLFVANSDICDFVVWQPSKSIIVRLFKDEPFWHEAYAKASEFFQKILLPELLGNYYSNRRR